MYRYELNLQSGKQGFDALTRLVESSQCKKLTYHTTTEALALFEGLLDV